MSVEQKPQLSFLQIWNMCFGFLGIQFGFALQNANVSRIFQTLGASIEDIPLLWIAAPVTGLLVQPVIGYFSDRTWTRMGRRRPYFFWGAVFSTAALIVMPNSPTLWVAAITLWILDASINVSMEPFRAFVGDMLPPEQRARGYAMQSFFIGIGAVVASSLPWLLSNVLGVSNDASDGGVPDSVVYSFYMGGGVFLAAVMWTVFRTREYSPQQLETFEASRFDLENQPHPAGQPTTVKQTASPSLAKGLGLWLSVGMALTIIVYWQQLDKQLYILGAGFLLFGALKGWATALQQQRPEHMVVALMTDLALMPGTMRQLAVVQFFTWFALFAMWIYTTAAVTATHFGSSDTSSALYNEGANWVGILFAAYNGFAALVALLLPVFAQRIGYALTHSVCLMVGALGLCSMLLIDDPDWLLLSMVAVGICWASILSLPYAILANALPAKKMGTYMGIFNVFIVVPQLLAATILGSLLRWLFDSDPLFALLIGGLSLLVAAVLMLFVSDNTRIIMPTDSRMNLR